MCNTPEIYINKLNERLLNYITGRQSWQTEEQVWRFVEGGVLTGLNLCWTADQLNMTQLQPVALVYLPDQTEALLLDVQSLFISDGKRKENNTWPCPTYFFGFSIKALSDLQIN